jgi:hypothetical protein
VGASQQSEIRAYLAAQPDWRFAERHNAEGSRLCTRP